MKLKGLFGSLAVAGLLMACGNGADDDVEVVQADSFEDYLLDEYGTYENTASIFYIEHGAVEDELDVEVTINEDVEFSHIEAFISYPATIRSYYSYDENLFVKGEPTDEESYNMLTTVDALSEMPEGFESGFYEDGVFTYDVADLIENEGQHYGEVVFGLSHESNPITVTYVQEGSIHHENMRLNKARHDASDEGGAFEEDKVEVNGEDYVRYSQELAAPEQEEQE